MSKFAETADSILEILHNGENVSTKEIEDKLPHTGAAIINFLNEFGLIELNEGTARITGSGLELLGL